ncbi:MAG TPA: polyphenol oxidase family protein [Acidobacteriota bacterium]
MTAEGPLTDAGGVSPNAPLAETGGVLQLDNLQRAAGFRHGFETRRGRLADAVAGPVARLRQVHGAAVRRLPAAASEQQPFFAAALGSRPEGDALITDLPGVTVAVAVADCLPILIADPRAGAVAAVHGGWRGIAGGVLEAAIGALGSAFGSRPADLILGIGPAIGPCCFEVGEEVIEALAARGYGEMARVEAGRPEPGSAGPRRPHCDLAAVAVAIAVDAGVPPGQIEAAGLCTRCNSDWLWSYRKDGERAGRMLCGIARI